MKYGFTLLVALFCVAVGNVADADTFFFSNGSPSGLNGLHSGSVVGTDVTATFTAGPGSAVIATDAQRLGVNSSSNSGVVDPFPNRMNLMSGSQAGVGESIRFSFNQPGILNTLYFDGMKDESLEYFMLQTPSGAALSIFDFEAQMRLTFQGFDPADMQVTNFTMADDAQDDITGLAIPFQPGQEFVLTYGQVNYANLLPGYIPMNSGGVPTGDLPNGARFEGVSVTVLPEPGCLSLIASVALALTTRRQVCLRMV
jgi:hypothetical protein